MPFISSLSSWPLILSDPISTRHKILEIIEPKENGTWKQMYAQVSFNGVLSSEMSQLLYGKSYI